MKLRGLSVLLVSDLGTKASLSFICSVVHLLPGPHTFASTSLTKSFWSVLGLIQVPINEKSCRRLEDAKVRCGRLVSDSIYLRRSSCFNERFSDDLLWRLWILNELVMAVDIELILRAIDGDF